MKNRVLTLVTVLALLLFGAILAAAQPSAQPQDQTAAQPGATDQSAKPAKAHHAHMAASKAETLSGTVSSVDADKHLLVVSGSDGVPYNFTVSKGTKITSGGSKAKLSDLQQGKQVSVSFVDMKKHGDLARSVEAQ